MAPPHRREVTGGGAGDASGGTLGGGGGEEEAGSLAEMLATPVVRGAEAVAVAEPDPTIRIRP